MWSERGFVFVDSMMQISAGRASAKDARGARVAGVFLALLL